jgi:hypothetical protein
MSFRIDLGTRTQAMSSAAVPHKYWPGDHADLRGRGAGLDGFVLRRRRARRSFSTAAPASSPERDRAEVVRAAFVHGLAIRDAALGLFVVRAATRGVSAWACACGPACL